MVELFPNSGDPDQMQHSVVSDLGLHYLPVIRLGVSSLQWARFSNMDIHVFCICIHFCGDRNLHFSFLGQIHL